MNAIEQPKENVDTNRTLAGGCLASCKKLITQIGKTKNALLAEFRDTFALHEHLLHQALNEAEALAWETDCPHLIFPMLATEKARAVAAWDARQQSIRGTRFPLPLAA